MLQTLKIKNYAIISEVDIDFHKGLNIITGETGAGKSILMGALGLILGQRADSKSIISNEDKCIVEGIFSIKKYKLKNYFNDCELDYDDTCILRREVTSSGKSRAFINDTPVSLNLLKNLGEKLVDIVSQHETLELNESSFQLSILDAIADNDNLRETYFVAFNEFKNADKEYRDLLNREAKARQDEDYFKFVLNELIEANIDEHEQDGLENELSNLSNAESIKEVAFSSFNTLSETDSSIIDQLRNIKSNISPTSKHHKLLKELVERIESTIQELKDIATEFENIAEQTQASPERLQQIENRLQLLFNLQKKHRAENNSALIELQNKLQLDIEALGTLQSKIEATEKDLAKQKSTLLELATELSLRRKNAIPNIEKEVKYLLENVSMPDAVLQISLQKLNEENLNENGFDKIEFLFSANKGSNFQAMNKVASGGELSRLMLCIKSLISDKVSLPTIIFDEIDTGISGEAAAKVSVVLKNHSIKHQVLAITHLPQIAAKADSHFTVFKQSNSHKTISNIRLLKNEERMNELAVMLSGNNPTEKVLSAAKELLN